MLPTAIALGSGAEFRAPMAHAVIGGLITSTLLTLIVVPVVYTWLDDFGAWAGARVRAWTAAPGGSGDVEAAPVAGPEASGDGRPDGGPGRAPAPVAAPGVTTPTA
jgi:HAE1 family hydrophobic/amphiphilic exporter-1